MVLGPHLALSNLKAGLCEAHAEFGVFLWICVLTVFSEYISTEG